MRIFPLSRGGRIRLFALLILLGVAAYFSNAQVLCYYLLYTPHEGDIVFQSLPKCDLVDAIEGITHSPYSHCGVVLREENRWVVIEAIGEVGEYSLFRWIQRGRNAGFSVYRLKPFYTPRIPEFKKNLLSYLGQPYDFDYEMSDKAIYCSELVYKAFQKATGEQMGKLEKFGELDWRPYADFIKFMQGNEIPMERVMITPKSLSTGRQMELVHTYGI